MKFNIVKKIELTEKATHYELITESGSLIDVWLPNKSVTVENNTVEIPDWLMIKNNKLRAIFPDFVPTEPIKETTLDVLKDIREILKQMNGKCD